MPVMAGCVLPLSYLLPQERLDMILQPALYMHPYRAHACCGVHRPPSKLRSKPLYLPAPTASLTTSVAADTWQLGCAAKRRTLTHFETSMTYGCAICNRGGATTGVKGLVQHEQAPSHKQKLRSRLSALRSAGGQPH